MRADRTGEHFEPTLPGSVTGTTWWCTTDQHEDLIVEPLQLEPEDWADLCELPSKPVDLVMVRTLPEDVMRHEQRNTDHPHDEYPCLPLDEAVRSYHHLHGLIYRQAAWPRHDLRDDGLLVVEGRA